METSSQECYQCVLGNENIGTVKSLQFATVSESWEIRSGEMQTVAPGHNRRDEGCTKATGSSECGNLYLHPSNKQTEQHQYVYQQSQMPVVRGV